MANGNIVIRTEEDFDSITVKKQNWLIFQTLQCHIEHSERRDNELQAQIDSVKKLQWPKTAIIGFFTGLGAFLGIQMKGH